MRLISVACRDGNHADCGNTSCADFCHEDKLASHGIANMKLIPDMDERLRWQPVDDRRW